MSTKSYTTGSTAGTLAAGDDTRLAQVATNTSAISTLQGNVNTNTSNLVKLSLTPTASKTAAYTAAAQDFVMADASGGTFTITLPATPSDGTLIAVKKTDSSALVVTVATGTGDTYSNGATSAVLAVQGHSITWRYTAATKQWVGLSSDLPLTATDSRYSKPADVTAAIAAQATTDAGQHF